MKKFLKSGLMVLLVATFAVPLSAFAQRNLKIGLGDPIDSDQGVLALRFKEIVEKASEGRYKVDIFVTKFSSIADLNSL